MKTYSFFFLALVALFFVSCTDDNDDQGGDVTQPADNVVVAQDSSLGAILTDEAGLTLYFFTKDAFDESVCFDGCLASWPVFYRETLQISAELDITDFGTTTRPDGTKQTTYKGWPLYYFAGDSAPGDVNGEDVGKVWYVAKPDYTIMLVDNQLLGLDGVE